jgi:circadian clock protein KaiC
VVLIEKIMSDFGAPRRRISVKKLRGVCFRDGHHDMAIETGGVIVYPRLVAARTRNTFSPSVLKSGSVELDELLGGGLNRGTSALFLGPAGSGKSSLAALFACHAAESGEHAAFYIFEESMNTFLQRTAGMGMDIKKYMDNGTITVQQVDPAELAPGEFVSLVCESVQRDKARIVVIDSLNGYMNAMPSDQLLLLQMHELLTYLGQMQVVTLMTVAQHGMLGPMQSPVDLSYLADTVVLLRFFEFAGELRQAISVVKKRDGAHERTIREMKLTSQGPVVSEVLREFKGVLTGVPTYAGSGAPLLKKQDEQHP